MISGQENSSTFLTRVFAETSLREARQFSYAVNVASKFQLTSDEIDLFCYFFAQQLEPNYSSEVRPDTAVEAGISRDRVKFIRKIAETISKEYVDGKKKINEKVLRLLNRLSISSS